MRAIIIGAGRGSRLQDLTDQVPKTFVSVMGRPMIEWIVESLAAAGFSKSDIVFISGYKAEVVRACYPEFTFVQNEGWESNNILASLLCARSFMMDGFVSTYADIIYTKDIAKRVREAPFDVALGCDTNWRARYHGRTEHPETDAEKLRAEGTRVVELSRKIPGESATGEFIGVMKCSRKGAAAIVDAYDAARLAHGEGHYREGRTFPKAYLIDLLAEMIPGGTEFHRVDTHGGYMEIDTVQDRQLADQWWRDVVDT